MKRKITTLSCVGPHMTKDGKTTSYRDVIEILVDDHRMLTSFGRDESSKRHEFMKATYTRV